MSRPFLNCSSPMDEAVIVCSARVFYIHIAGGSGCGTDGTGG